MKKHIRASTLVELAPVSKEKRSAFTLVELLVVIGIIAVLISILLPTLAGARQEAVSAQCLSQLKQIGNAAMMYANDNNGWFPPSQGDSKSSPTDEKFLDYSTNYDASVNPKEFAVWEAMAKYAGYKPMAYIVGGTNTNYVAINTPIFYCPADNQLTNNVNWATNNMLAHGATPDYTTNTGSNNGKIRYWWTANPAHQSNKTDVDYLNNNCSGNEDLLAANWYAHMYPSGTHQTFSTNLADFLNNNPSTIPWGDNTKPCEVGYDYLRKIGDKHQDTVAICVDRSKQEQASGGWFYMHGNPTKKTACWKNELFGDGHAESRRADQVVARWSLSNPESW